MNNNLTLISQNINKINSRKNTSDTSKKCWIALAIHELIDNGINEAEDIAKELKASFKLAPLELICAARELLRQGIFEFHQDLSGEAMQKKPNTVSNFGSALSDIALEKFFPNKEYTLRKKEAFIDAFEDVYNEKSSYCIVPIENTVSGKLLNFYAMIANYNLKISAICDVEHPGQDSFTRFALLTKAPVFFGKSSKNRKYLEISLGVNDGSDITRILTAAAECGLTPKKLDSVPYAHIPNEYSYNIIFKLSKNASLEEFFLYLTLDMITYTPIGIFALVE